MTEQFKNKVTISKSNKKYNKTLDVGDILVCEGGYLYIFATVDSGYYSGYMFIGVDDGVYYDSTFIRKADAHQYAIDEGFKIYRKNEIKVILGELIS